MPIVIPTSAYPLSWPMGVSRTNGRRNSPFAKTGQSRVLSISNEVEEIRRQLHLLKAKTIVISSNMPLRSDGIPYGDSPQNPGGDPGVALYWTVLKHRAGHSSLIPYTMPCDKWHRVVDNLHALALSIEAMRGMERWGAVTVEQAFAGFAALPAGSGGSEIGVPVYERRPWRKVFDVEKFAAILGAKDLLAIVKTRYREAVRDAHPDRGGSLEKTAELNDAMADAERELTK